MTRSFLHTRSFRRIHLSILDTDELKMALRARKVSGAFKKQAPGLEPGPLDPESSALTMWPPRLHKMHGNHKLFSVILM